MQNTLKELVETPGPRSDPQRLSVYVTLRYTTQWLRGAEEHRDLQARREIIKHDAEEDEEDKEDKEEGRASISPSPIVIAGVAAASRLYCRAIFSATRLVCSSTLSRHYAPTDASADASVRATDAASGRAPRVSCCLRARIAPSRLVAWNLVPRSAIGVRKRVINTTMLCNNYNDNY